MQRTLGEWNGIAIQSYGTLYLISFLASLGLLVFLLRRRAQNLAPAVDLTLLMLLAYTLGAHVLYALLDRTYGFREWFTVDRLKSGFWGGQLVFAIAAGPYLLVSRVPLRHLGDALAVTWAAATVFHKTGCFLSGCCQGLPSDMPWAVSFPAVWGPPGEAVHPTQLYDAGAALILGLGLWVAFLRRAAEGRLMLWWGGFYALAKFASEWFRGDAGFPIVGRFRLAMVPEVAVAAVCLALWARPAPWDRLVERHAARAERAKVPDGTLGRGASFGRGLLRYVLALVLAALVEGFLGWTPAFFVAYFCFYLMLSLFGSLANRGVRLVDAQARRPGVFRMWLHALIEAIAPLTLIALLRPLLDRHGRGMGDAAAGLFRVRQAQPIGSA